MSLVFLRNKTCNLTSNGFHPEYKTQERKKKKSENKHCHHHLTLTTRRLKTLQLLSATSLVLVFKITSAQLSILYLKKKSKHHNRKKPRDQTILMTCTIKTIHIFSTKYFELMLQSKTIFRTPVFLLFLTDAFIIPSHRTPMPHKH